jgi:hypothetical protein
MADKAENCPKFDEVWGRIVAHAGETFHAHNGQGFTYKISGDKFYTSAPEQTIGKADFEHAYGMVPVHKDTLDDKIVKGPAYVWEVLHDKRVSKGEW